MNYPLIIRYHIYVFCRYYTFQELQDAVDNKFDELTRSFAYCSYDKYTGNGFHANFLKMMLDPSLMYRLYTPNAKGVR